MNQKLGFKQSESVSILMPFRNLLVPATNFEFCHRSNEKLLAESCASISTYCSEYLDGDAQTLLGPAPSVRCILTCSLTTCVDYEFIIEGGYVIKIYIRDVESPGQTWLYVDCWLNSPFLPLKLLHSRCKQPSTSTGSRGTGMLRAKISSTAEIFTGLQPRRDV